MVFRLHIDCDNAAFEPSPAPELARILRSIADRLDTVEGEDYTDQHGGWIKHYQTVLDSNGNDVGRYAVKDK